MNLIKLGVASLSVANAFVTFDPSGDIDRTWEQIVEENGYSYEKHSVTTDDGYILGLFRIPGKKGGSQGKAPVYLQHGIIDSSDGWLMNFAENSPALVLADAGYDVWLGNSRGNKYSRKHAHLDPDWDDSFWWFSFDEMGEYDVPANMDYIMKYTGVDKLGIVAHSQGTSQMFYALANNMDYMRDHTSIFHAFAPVTRMAHEKSGLIDLVAFNTDALQAAASTFGIYELFPSGFIGSAVGRVICGTVPAICELGISFISDTDPSVDSSDRLAVYSGHFPSGTSLRCLVHYGQLVNNGNFARYDYESKHENRKKYGQDTPPLIDVSSITDIPVALYKGSLDDLGDTKDTEWLTEQMKPTLVFENEYRIGHISFLIGKDMSFWNVDGMYLMKKYHPVDGSKYTGPVDWLHPEFH